MQRGQSHTPCPVQMNVIVCKHCHVNVEAEGTDTRMLSGKMPTNVPMLSRSYVGARGRPDARSRLFPRRACSR